MTTISVTPPTAQPERIEVRTGSRTSTIIVGEGALAGLSRWLDEAGVGPRRFVVSNPKVWGLHGAAIQHALGPVPVILVPDGERYKTVRTTERIYDGLIKGGADRGSAIVAVGGGVVGDMAGFAAASFLRGITLAHVPTTLLAQVDSSIGGKTGVNHALGKNLIGAFHQPAVVVADPTVLSTLTRREFRSGLFEVVKYGMIASRPLFDRLRKGTRALFRHDASVLLPAIAESARIKAAVVSADERESGLRRILNFGHTVGHALEAVTHYRRFRHGEAIGYGMLVAADLAVARGVLSDEDRVALATLIDRLGALPKVTDLSIAEILDAVRRDKKVLDGRLHFVLCTGIGTTVVVDDVTDDELKAALVRLGLAS